MKTIVEYLVTNHIHNGYKVSVYNICTQGIKNNYNYLVAKVSKELFQTLLDKNILFVRNENYTRINNEVFNNNNYIFIKPSDNDTAATNFSWGSPNYKGIINIEMVDTINIFADFNLYTWEKLEKKYLKS